MHYFIVEYKLTNKHLYDLPIRVLVLIYSLVEMMSFDINLIALKVDTMIAQGYQFRKQVHQNDFLKYNHKM